VNTLSKDLKYMYKNNKTIIIESIKSKKFYGFIEQYCQNPYYYKQ